MDKLLRYNQIFESATHSTNDYKTPQSTESEVKVQFTKELEDIIIELEAENNYVAFELLWLNEKTSKYFNGLKIDKVDLSKNQNCFDVTVKGRKSPMQIVNFIRYYFKNMFNKQEVDEFLKMYNSALSGQKITKNPILVPEFKYNPKDVRSTFLSLVTKTYPHGHEDEVLQFLPNLEKDSVGNYYKIIGDSKPKTMFTCHLDTADREQHITKLYSKIENGDEFIITDGNSILGADDKAGVTVLLYMMAHKVPGLYYFFIGEERGGIGSGRLSAIYEQVEYLKNIERCVSFDRRNYHSVITQQIARVCCSNDFGTALCKEYNNLGLNLSLDPTGIYTDSASFLDEIPECTNISVGYMHEHTKSEFQNITYLQKLCKASVSVNWDSLPTVRKIGLDQEVVRKYKGLISDIKESFFYLEIKVVGDISGGVCVRCDLEDGTIEDVYESLTSLSVLLNKHRVESNVYFEETYIKIPLK